MVPHALQKGRAGATLTKQGISGATMLSVFPPKARQQ